MIARGHRGNFGGTIGNARQAMAEHDQEDGNSSQAIKGRYARRLVDYPCSLRTRSGHRKRHLRSRSLAPPSDEKAGRFNRPTLARGFQRSRGRLLILSLQEGRCPHPGAGRREPRRVSGDEVLYSPPVIRGETGMPAAAIPSAPAPPRRQPQSRARSLKRPDGQPLSMRCRLLWSLAGRETGARM